MVLFLPNKARLTASLAGLLATPSTAQELLFRIDSDVPNSGFGHSIEPAPDVDGDGVPDVLTNGIGLHIDPTAFYPIGLYSGRDGSPVHFFEQEGGGEADGSMLGFDDAVVGDFNGDGVADYAVSDPRNDYVQFVSGADSSFLFRIEEPSSGMFGGQIHAMGDVDADGRPDFAIGFPGGTSNDEGDPNFPGRVRMVSGKTRTVLFERIGTEFSYARAVASADVDGDGVDDLLVGAPNLGLVEVLSGVDGQLIHKIDRGDNSWHGHALCGVGDTDGDGNEDFLVGAPRVPGSNKPGKAYLVSGASGKERLTFVGEDGDQAGFVVADAGDVNGDGRTELAVCAAGFPPRLYSSLDGSLLYEYRLDDPDQLFFGGNFSRAQVTLTATDWATSGSRIRCTSATIARSWVRCSPSPAPSCSCTRVRPRSPSATRSVSRSDRRPPERRRCSSSPRSTERRATAVRCSESLR